MDTQKKWTRILIGTIAVVVLILGTTAFVVGSSEAASAVTARISAVATGIYHGRGGPGFPGAPGAGMGKQTHLAEALGITVEELQEAYEEARLAAIDAAVEAGLITQEQADEMIIGGGFGKGGPRGFGHRGMEGQAGLIDFQALLAEALDISVEELQGAMEQARDAGIAQAIEEGLITQEQADQMQAFQELRNYIDKEALMAEALGISAEELEEARAGGETLSTLLEELDLTAVEVREALEAAHERAVAEAVADGVITQEQADQILSHKGFGFRGPGSGGPGFGGRGRRFGGGNGGFHPQFPFPNAPAEGA